MCGKDPLSCHRTILVARELVDRGCEVQHILGDGALEPHGQAMSRLIEQLALQPSDMFRSQVDTLKEAYDVQAQRIAYQRKPQHARYTGRAD